MTSVPNHQPLLNGNKLSIIWILLLFLLSQSCATRRFEREQVDLNEQYQKKKAEIEIKKEENKPVVIEKEVIPEIVPVLPDEKLNEKESFYPKEKKERYTVAYLLHLSLDDMGNEDYKPQRLTKAAQEFYMGATLALEDSISKLDLNLEVHILDITNASDTLFTDILRKLDNLKPDLIVGPFLNKNIQLFSDYALKNKISIISPISSEKDVLLSNPYFISLNPSNELTIIKTISYIKKNYKDHNIILICDNKKDLNEYVTVFNNQSDTGSFAGFHPLLVNDANWGTAHYLKYLASEKNLILMPLENTVVINSVATNLTTRTEKGITLIAPYKWLEFPAVDILQLQQLNGQFISDPQIDFKDSLTKDFIIDYRDKYRTEPTDYSYKGYQSAIMYGNLMISEGKYFQRAFKGDKRNSTYQEFGRVEKNAGFENTTVLIFKLIDYELQREILKNE